MVFLQPNRSEHFKGAWHAGMGALAFGALAYNVAAWCERKEPHLARNAVLYLGLTLYEGTKAWKHWEGRVVCEWPLRRD